MVNVFGYVDYFRGVLDCANHDATHLVSYVLSVSNNNLAPLVLTHELAAAG